jgi:hypothetical protein
MRVKEISLHLLDIAENSVSAQSKTISIAICEDLVQDRLLASILDDGLGMSSKKAAQAVDPFFTSRTTRKVGLGLPLFQAAAEGCNGGLSINSSPGKGTRVDVIFQHSHIDRMPIGDLAGTMLTLIVAYPEVRWLLDYQVILPPPYEPKQFLLDTQPIIEELGDVSICEPEILAFLRSFLQEGVNSVQASLMDRSSLQIS